MAFVHEKYKFKVEIVQSDVWAHCEHENEMRIDWFMGDVTCRTCHRARALPATWSGSGYETIITSRG